MSGVDLPASGGYPQPVPETFIGQFIMLTPLDVESDVAELFAISHTDDEARKLWRYLPCGPFATAGEQAAFLRDWQSRPDIIVYTVRENNSGRCVGSISLMSIRPEYGVAELGFVWYAPFAQRTKVNTEASYLLLRYCFETLHYRRMEWKCDTRNEPSQKAALRLGFTFEGIFRKHMVVKGESRDTAWFAMLDDEWPVIGGKIRQWLYEDDSVSLGEMTRRVSDDGKSGHHD